MALEAINILEILWGIILSIITSFEAIIRWVYPAAYTKSVKGDIVLITGGGSGIGRLMSLKLADLGAIIVTWDVNTKGNEETVSMIKANGGTAYGYTVDLTKKEKIYEVAEEVKKDVGVVKILINNAGIVSGSALLDTPDEKIIRTFEVNVFAQFWTMKTFLPDMIKVDGVKQSGDNYSLSADFFFQMVIMTGVIPVWLEFWQMIFFENRFLFSCSTWNEYGVFSKF